MYPTFSLSAAHLDSARAYRAAMAELERRTGREFWPCPDAQPHRHVTESEVLTHHPDLCESLDVRPCADGCGQPGVRYRQGWVCVEHAKARDERR